MTIYSLRKGRHIPFPILNHSCSISGSIWCFLTCTQVLKEVNKVLWYSHLFQNFPQFVVIHTIKGFSVVSEAEVDVYLKLFFLWSNRYWQFISGSSTFSKSSLNIWKFLVQFSSVAQLFPTLCDPVDCSTPGLPVHHHLLEFTQTHVHWVSDAIQPSHPLSSPSPPAFYLSQYQGLL